MQDADFQFYPTSKDLVKKAWSLFKTQPTRVLEPSAGEGHLAVGSPTYKDYLYSHAINIDCIEIDVTKHSILRDKHLNVVGLDFLTFNNGAQYSHIIMNPPFAYGAKHVLHAWNILYEGEIVAIVNAETIKNPFSRERKELVELIESRGSVDFIQDAFLSHDTERKTAVEIAIIHLEKTSDYETIIMKDILDGLNSDNRKGDDYAFEYTTESEVAISNNVIENAVLVFNLAMQAEKNAVFANAKSAYYSAMLGETMSRIDTDTKPYYPQKEFRYIRGTLQKSYDELKDKAWASILRSSNVTKHLSAKAQAKVNSEFELIKKLDFTTANIYGFLSGLVEKKGEIQKEMACEIFDNVVRHHSENTVFYMGWKSNDKHRTGGMRIKTTRFIIPNHVNKGYSSADYRTVQFLADFDKVFAMLDGKHETENSLADVFKNQYKELVNGERVDSSYFQIRYYPNVGTIHFFPKSKVLIDRLNRFVGQLRGWLPSPEQAINEAFWLQYDNADKFDKELRQSLKKSKTYSWDDPIDDVVYSGRGKQEESLINLGNHIGIILEKHGINIDTMLSHKQFPLLSVA